MKIQPYKSLEFLKNINEKPVTAALVYGPDSGGVSNLVKNISEQIVEDINDPFSVADISSPQMEENGTIVYDEMMAVSFGAGKRLVMIKNVDSKQVEDNIISCLDNLPENICESSFLLISAGDLPPSSGLRKYFESAGDNLASFPRYKEDSKDLSGTIHKIVKEKNLFIEPEAANYLSQSCQGDSKIIESEIEKLSLYLEDGTSKITYEDVMQAIGDTTEVQINDICSSIFSGDRYNIETSFKRSQKAGIPEIAVIRGLQRYIEKLHIAYYYVKEGNTVEMAIKYIKPPIFYKNIPQFKKHLLKLLNEKEEKIFNKYSRILQAEIDMKETGAEQQIITSRLLQKIAS